MSNSIWHDKNEKPVKVLHKNYIIITKWGSVLGESDVDSGYTIETDWAYLTDIIAQADKAERLQMKVDVLEPINDSWVKYCEQKIKQIQRLQEAVDYALQVLDNVSEIGGIDLEIAKIKQLIKGNKCGLEEKI